LASALAPWVCLLVSSTASPSDQPSILKAARGETVEREVAGGDRHRFDIELAEGTLFAATLRQQGIDLVIDVHDGGRLLFSVDSPTGADGAESILLVARRTGRHAFVVRALDDRAPKGRYQLVVDDVRPATARDRQIAAVREDLARGWERREAFDFAAARQAGERALATLEQLHGTTSPETVEAVDLLGYVYDETGRFEDGARMFERSLAIRGGTPGTPESVLLGTESNLAWLELGAGRYAQAARRFRSVVERREGRPATGSYPLSAHSGLGVALLEEGRLEQSKAVLEDVLKRQEAQLGPSNAELGGTLGPLGRLALVSGRLDDAEMYCRRALDMRSRNNWGDWSRASDLRCLGGVAARRGQAAAAEAYFQRSLETCERLFGPRSLCEAETRLEEGRSAVAACRLDAAQGALENAHRTFAAILPATHPRVEQAGSERAGVRSARSGCGLN
jgi:tetratricopeptide (TPR) repeat protein